MKYKNPYGFWLRWMGISILHAIAFTSFWMSNTWLFASWYGFPLLNFVSGTLLAALQYWAMPLTMRPNAKRWFSISILAHALAVTIHTFVVQAFNPSPNSLDLWLSLFLIPALAQSWALSEHFKKTWLFALAAFLPAYILFAQLPYPEIYQNYAFFEIAVQILRAVAIGGSLVFLQKYQRKESDSFDITSHERLAVRDEEETISQEDIMRLAQQKLS